MNVLVVEDEALVALLVQEVVEEAGHACVGPAASVGEACALIDSCHVDAALLDIWLKDNEFVYPAAQKLASRGVPVRIRVCQSRGRNRSGIRRPTVDPQAHGREAREGMAR